MSVRVGGSVDEGEGVGGGLRAIDAQLQQRLTQATRLRLQRLHGGDSKSAGKRRAVSPVGDEVGGEDGAEYVVDEETQLTPLARELEARAIAASREDDEVFDRIHPPANPTADEILLSHGFLARRDDVTLNCDGALCGAEMTSVTGKASLIINLNANTVGLYGMDLKDAEDKIFVTGDVELTLFDLSEMGVHMNDERSTPNAADVIAWIDTKNCDSCPMDEMGSLGIGTELDGGTLTSTGPIMPEFAPDDKPRIAYYLESSGDKLGMSLLLTYDVEGEDKTNLYNEGFYFPLK